MAYERIKITKEKDWRVSKDFDWRESEGRSPWLVDEEIEGAKLSKFYTTAGYIEKPVVCQPENKISSEIEKSIKESRKLLELEDDWDGEGSLGYAEPTLNKAEIFLTDNALTFWRNNAVWVTAPDFCPGPNGSIDLLWKLEDRELLINIPVDENNLAGYYGDNSQNGSIIKGKLNLAEKNQWILMWLMK